MWTFSTFPRRHKQLHLQYIILSVVLLETVLIIYTIILD
jgi:hypothetical protein